MCHLVNRYNWNKVTELLLIFSCFLRGGFQGDLLHVTNLYRSWIVCALNILGINHEVVQMVHLGYFSVIYFDKTASINLNLKMYVS